MSKQQTENRRKKDIHRDKTVLAVSEKYIDALYYNEMFYSTDCCNTAATVEREMKNLNSKSSKILAFKENISTRVMYWGWEDLIMHWYKNGKDFTPKEIA